MHITAPNPHSHGHLSSTYCAQRHSVVVGSGILHAGPRALDKEVTEPSDLTVPSGKWAQGEKPPGRGL